GQPRSTRPARPWRVTALRAASVTAALLVIAGGGYGVSRLLQGGHNAGISSSSAPGRAAGPAGSRNGAAIAGGGGSSAPGPDRAGLGDRPPLLGRRPPAHRDRRAARFRLSPPWPGRRGEDSPQSW